MYSNCLFIRKLMISSSSFLVFKLSVVFIIGEDITLHSENLKRASIFLAYVFWLIFILSCFCSISKPRKNDSFFQVILNSFFNSSMSSTSLLWSVDAISPLSTYKTSIVFFSLNLTIKLSNCNVKLLTLTLR